MFINIFQRKKDIHVQRIKRKKRIKRTIITLSQKSDK